MTKKRVPLLALAAIENDEEFVNKAEQYFEPRFICPGQEYMSMLHIRINAIHTARRDLHERVSRLLLKLN